MLSSEGGSSNFSSDWSLKIFAEPSSYSANFTENPLKCDGLSLASLRAMVILVRVVRTVLVLVKMINHFLTNSVISRIAFFIKVGDFSGITTGSCS